MTINNTNTNTKPRVWPAMDPDAMKEQDPPRMFRLDDRPEVWFLHPSGIGYGTLKMMAIWAAGYSWNYVVKDLAEREIIEILDTAEESEGERLAYELIQAAHRADYAAIATIDSAAFTAHQATANVYRAAAEARIAYATARILMDRVNDQDTRTAMTTAAEASRVASNAAGTTTTAVASAGANVAPDAVKAATDAAVAAHQIAAAASTSAVSLLTLLTVA